MDWKQTLEKIRKKQPYELTPFEVAFLKARKSYLSKEELEKYGLVEKKDKVNEKKKEAKEV